MPSLSWTLTRSGTGHALYTENECGRRLPAIRQSVNHPAYLCGTSGSIPAPGQWVKKLALPQQWLRFDPWPGNFHMLWGWPGKKKKSKNKR